MVGASGVKDIQTLLVGRVPFGRSFQIVGPSASVEFAPAAKFGWRMTKEGKWTVDLTSDMAGSIAAALVPKRGDYAVPGLPELLFRVVPTHILDATGKHITEVIG